MKVLARISVTVVLAMLVSSIAGPASAAKRQFTAQFFNVDTGTFVDDLCVDEGETLTDVALRFTNQSKQGPPIRTVGATAPTGFSGVSAGSPISNKGAWTATSSVNPLALDSGGGQGQLKGDDWVEVPVSFTAPQAPGTYEWLTAAAGPGNSGNSKGSAGYTAANTLTVTVSDSCPPPVCPGGNCPPPTPQNTCEGITATIEGGLGDSLIIGTSGNDVIWDLAGHNHIEGRGGNDLICTGSGNDVVLTLGGNDRIHDQGGQNLIRTAGGSDTITTGRGASRIAAGVGTDRVTAGTGRNNIRLGKGRDRATTSSGNDQIKGAAGKDRIIAGDGKNRLGGGRGNDKLRAGSGRDRMNGGRGRDVCRADGGKNKFRRCEVRRGNGA